MQIMIECLAEINSLVWGVYGGKHVFMEVDLWFDPLWIQNVSTLWPIELAITVQLKHLDIHWKFFFEVKLLRILFGLILEILEHI